MTKRQILLASLTYLSSLAAPGCGGDADGQGVGGSGGMAGMGTGGTSATSGTATGGA
ncbi:MAG: hypothetical protein JW751_29140 [Polyangiaceae bacterium]|nr:hypothetical protein [Polyangiaceae bacterium]